MDNDKKAMHLNTITNKLDKPIHVFIRQNGKRSPAFDSGSELNAGKEGVISALAAATDGSIIVQSAFAHNIGGGGDGLRIKIGETKPEYLEVRQFKRGIYEIDMYFADIHNAFKNHIDPEVRHPENGN